MVSASVPPSAVVRLFDRIGSIRALVVGDLMLDEYLEGEVTRVSAEAPVPVVRVARERRALGGAGHVAHLVAVLGAGTQVVGIVGEDGAGRSVLEECAAAGIDHSGVVVESGRPTTHKTRVVSGPHQIVRLDQEEVGALPSRALESLLERLRTAAPADVVVLSDYCKGVVSSEVVDAVMELARTWGSVVVVDTKHRDLARFAGADVVKLNLQEFMDALADPEGVLGDGRAPTAELERSVHQCSGAGALVVTLGEQGLDVVTGSEDPVHLAATTREVFDVAGAGDVVAGVVAVGLAAGLVLVDAAAVANVAAGLSVTKPGVSPVDPGELLDELMPDPDGGIVTRSSLLTRARAWRLAGHKVVFTNGCFDLFHHGHLELLRTASKLGDRLVVAVDSDRSVRRLKGSGRPLIDEVSRTAIIAALDFVDAVVTFDDDLLDLIDQIRPDVLVKGADYEDRDVVGRSLVEGNGGRVELVPLREGHSTTAIVERVRAGSSDDRTGGTG